MKTLLMMLVTLLVSAAVTAQDLSTPKSAARAFTEALDKGDATAARAAAVTDEKNAAFVDVMTEFMKETRKLNEAAIERYGDAGKDVGGAESQKDLTKYYDEAEITETGDTATITRQDEPSKALRLRKVENEWKVDVASLLGSEIDIEKTVAMFRALNAAMREVAAEITEGKHASADAAKYALAMKNAAFFSTADAATTNPSEAPTTTPSTQPADK